MFQVICSCIIHPEPEEQLIVGDVDMAVFNKGFSDKLNDGRIHIVGADLVPEGQYLMCYIAMPVAKWREVMMIEHGQTVQYKLDRLLGFINCENFRGNYWAKDQEEAYNHIHLYEIVSTIAQHLVHSSLHGGLIEMAGLL